MDIYKVLHEVQHERKKSDIFSTSPLGGLAQLGERLHGTRGQRFDPAILHQDNVPIV